MIKTESLELSAELLEAGINGVYYNNERLEITFTGKDSKDDAVSAPIFEFIHTTLEELDNSVNGSMDHETYNKLRYHLTKELGPIWNKIYVPVTTKNGQQKQNNGNPSRIQKAFESLRQQSQNLFTDEYKIPYIAIGIQ